MLGFRKIIFNPNGSFHQPLIKTGAYRVYVIPCHSKNTAIIKWYNKKVHWRPPMHKYTLFGADSFWGRSFTRLAGGVWQYTRIGALLLNLSAQLLNIIFH